MSLVTHVPPAALQPFAPVAYGYRVPASPSRLHRGLPSRHLTLVVELNAPLRVAGPRDYVAAHGVVGGLDTRPSLIDVSRPQEGLQYAVTPLGAHALLGVPAAELSGHVVDLADLLGSRAAELVDEVRSKRDWRERFGLLDTALLHRLDPGNAAVQAEVEEAWRLIFARSGQVRVAGVASHVGWSRRHLSERFRLATGVTPKQAARIARFEAARALLVGPEQPSLADVAARCGFTDQPHLAGEWHEMAGCSVGTWLREELPFLQDGRAVEPPESPA